MLQASIAATAAASQRLVQGDMVLSIHLESLYPMIYGILLRE